MWIFVVFFISIKDPVNSEDDVKIAVEGDVLTLRTRHTELERVNEVTWLFGRGDQIVRIAQMYQGFAPFYEETITGRVKMDPKTGALTIWNISTGDSGLYEVSLDSGSISERLRVDVYRPVSVPVIRPLVGLNQIQGPSERPHFCSVLCSVKNDRGLSVSWFKRGELVNQTSSPDLNIKLSLPLELDYDDPETYSCTAANPVSNRSVRLHTTEICPQHEDCQGHCGGTEALIRLVLAGLVGIATILCLVEHLRL